MKQRLPTVMAVLHAQSKDSREGTAAFAVFGRLNVVANGSEFCDSGIMSHDYVKYHAVM